MVLGGGTVLAVAAYIGAAQPVPEARGAEGALLGLSYALPATILLSLLFTVPSALALVFAMAGLRRRGLTMLSPWGWAVGGVVVAIPVAWMFGAMFREDPFELQSVHMALLGFGLLSGLAARWGYREVASDSAERNVATTSS